ncbi:MAG: DUF3313 domain-containing protein [Phycisphaeraceae bacterium]|nr:DUF3313 domain-containing protein [Phycisphaeraceae bacterium]
MMRLLCLAAVLVMVGSLVCGCANRPGKTQSGFLSNYDDLVRVSDAEFARIDAEALATLDSLYIEEVRLMVSTTPDGSPISEKSAQELTDHVRVALAKSFASEYRIADGPGEGVGRLRVAITEVKKPATLLNLHPASKITGAGLGGATIESEILDDRGTQIAALIEPRKGDQFELDTFAEFEDAMDAIDAWAAAMRKRLDSARGKVTSREHPSRAR